MFILSRHADLVVRGFPEDPSGDNALAFAVYLFLRGLPDLELTVDGWSIFQVVQETAFSLNAFGIMYVLPTGEFPIEVELTRELHSTAYRLRSGVVNELWNSLSDSKRWRLAYQYAKQQQDALWTWSEPIEGHVADA